MKIGPNKNSHPITVDNVMLLLYMYMYMRLLRVAGGMYVPGQISIGSFCVLRSRTCPCCYTVFNPSLCLHTHLSSFKAMPHIGVLP